ncbi:MAG: ATP-binding cassette domain-containing protein [Tissierellia bacterium]|nr:ATP-binding cassette domain-containing protein [Tissierellia bacterium]
MLIVDIKKKLDKFELDVNFETENEVIGLLGMSGSGKSMTLKCIAGIERPDSGRIVLNDKVLYDSSKRINLPPQERGIGYLFQDYALFPNMTVYQNIAVGIHKSVNKSEVIENILLEMGILDKVNHYPHQISGGEKQRVALARIVVNEPEILLLDEPFSALDEFLSWKIEMDMMETIEKHIKNAILVSHDKEEVYRMTDTVCVLDNGKSQSKRDTKELFSNPNTYASAILSGLKNFSEYRKVSDDTIFLEDFGISIDLPRDVFINEIGTVGIKHDNIRISDEDLGSMNVYKGSIKRVAEGIENSIYIIDIIGTESKKSFVIDSKENLDMEFNIGDMVYLEIPKSNIIIIESDE